MREIKFRARWKDTGIIIPDFMEQYTISNLNSDLFIVEQFTGLKDKNGKEVYEGDIVKYEVPHTKKPQIERVEWNEGVNAGWYPFVKPIDYDETSVRGTEFEDELAFDGEDFECKGTVFSEFIFLLYNIHMDNFEVIGNIYENPEMIK